MIPRSSRKVPSSSRSTRRSLWPRRDRERRCIYHFQTSCSVTSARPSPLPIRTSTSSRAPRRATWIASWTSCVIGESGEQQPRSGLAISVAEFCLCRRLLSLSDIGIFSAEFLSDDIDSSLARPEIRRLGELSGSHHRSGGAGLAQHFRDFRRGYHALRSAARPRHGAGAERILSRPRLAARHRAHPLGRAHRGLVANVALHFQ